MPDSSLPGSKPCNLESSESELWRATLYRLVPLPCPDPLPSIRRPSLRACLAGLPRTGCCRHPRVKVEPPKTSRAVADAWLDQAALVSQYDQPDPISRRLDVANVTASYAGGVLTLRIPVAERAKPRKIQISRDGADRQAIKA